MTGTEAIWVPIVASAVGGVASGAMGGGGGGGQQGSMMPPFPSGQIVGSGGRPLFGGSGQGPGGTPPFVPQANLQAFQDPLIGTLLGMTPPPMRQIPQTLPQQNPFAGYM